MRKFVSFVFALILCMSMTVPAFAAFRSPHGGGGGHGHHHSPKTGSSVVAVLALTSCTAGGIGIAAYKKSKK